MNESNTCISCGTRSCLTCPKQKTGTKGEPVSIAILTKPFLDLRKTTCQLQNLFIIITFRENNILVSPSVTGDKTQYIHIDYARREPWRNLRIMIHVKYLLHTSRHYDTSVTSTKVGVEALPRRRNQTQPRPYLPQERRVEHLTTTRHSPIKSTATNSFTFRLNSI
jgi:hypothetical protein